MPAIGVIVLGLLAIAIIAGGVALFQALAKPLNVSILGLRPFAFLINPIWNVIIDQADRHLKSTENTLAKWLSDLTDWTVALVTAPAQLSNEIYKGLTYLWHTALPTKLEATAKPIRSLAQKAESDVTALERTVASNLDRAEAYARSQAASAVSDAERFARAQVDSAVATVRAEIATTARSVERDAFSYADQAVAQLKTAEDEALAKVSQIATAAKTASENTAAALKTEIQTAEQQAVIAAQSAASGAEAAALEALNGVRGTVEGIGNDLATIEGTLGVAGLAGLIGTIPALATFVSALATETGLDNASCRSKVKDICSTDQAAWQTLLGGLASVGFAFSLAELAAAADPLIVRLAPIVSEAA